MADILLFHSVLGLRTVEREIAVHFERAGHSVILPDLFDGQSADNYEAGFALKDRIGDDAIIARAAEAVTKTPEDVVLSGVSLGAFLIGRFWGARPNAAGALLFSGIAPWMSRLRAGFPVSAHIARPDPFDDEAEFEGWSAEAGEVSLDLHRYDDVGHYFLDPSLPDYNEKAAEACLRRSLDFLSGL